LDAKLGLVSDHRWRVRAGKDEKAMSLLVEAAAPSKGDILDRSFGAEHARRLE
jgi:hypothetical protein